MLVQIIVYLSLCQKYQSWILETGMHVILILYYDVLCTFWSTTHSMWKWPYLKRQATLVDMHSSRCTTVQWKNRLGGVGMGIWWRASRTVHGIGAWRFDVGWGWTWAFWGWVLDWVCGDVINGWLPHDIFFSNYDKICYNIMGGGYKGGNIFYCMKRHERKPRMCQWRLLHRILSYSNIPQKVISVTTCWCSFSVLSPADDEHHIDKRGYKAWTSYL